MTAGSSTDACAVTELVAKSKNRSEKKAGQLYSPFVIVLPPTHTHTPHTFWSQEKKKKHSLDFFNKRGWAIAK